MTSTGTAQLPIPNTSPQAQEAHIFPTLTSANLLSIGQLCDDNCIATFTKNKLKITKNNQTILEGERNNGNGMWYIPIQSSQLTEPTPSANVITKLHPASELIQFLHAAAFSPCPSTWIKAVEKGFFSTWPGVTKEAINKFLPKSIHTSMGHLDQERKNLRSTRREINTVDTIKSIPSKDRTHEVYTKIQQNHVYSDQTGRFPVQSNRGHNYIMILYDYDTNSIHAEPLKNRSTSELTNAYSKIYKVLTNAGCQPRIHTLDNEAPSELLSLIEENNCTYEIVPPHIHRRNAAERAIRTFKNHFIAGISSVDPDFPLSLWDRLLPQATRTLNMLRPTRINPNISADTYFHGQHDYNRHPKAPPGTKTVAHLKPDQRASWAKHGVLGWYIGPSFKHYRCYRVYIPKTRSERVVDTVELFSTHSPTPTWDANKQIIQAAHDLTLALRNQQSNIQHLHKNKLDALHTLVNIFSPSTTEKHPLRVSMTATPKQLPRVHKIPTSPRQNQHIPQNTTPPRVGNEQPHIIPFDDDESHTPDPPPQPRRYMTRSQTAQSPKHIHHILNSATEQPSHVENISPHHLTQVCNAIVDPTTGKTLEYRHLMANPDTKPIWEKSCANEFGRLAQGVGDRVKGTNTIFFIPRSKVPKHKKVTYPRIVCDYRPTKTEPNRTRITVGGNLITYNDEVYTATADLLTAKLLICAKATTLLIY